MVPLLWSGNDAPKFESVWNVKEWFGMIWQWVNIYWGQWSIRKIHIRKKLSNHYVQPRRSQNMFPPNPGFAHNQTTHPNNMIYLSPEDEWKHWLYAVILTLSFQDLGFSFRVRVLGLRACCFGKSKKINPTKGFEHVKGYAEFAAGKPRVCSEHVWKKYFSTIFQPIFRSFFWSKISTMPLADFRQPPPLARPGKLKAPPMIW